MKRLSEHLDPAQVEAVLLLDVKMQAAQKKAKDLDRRALIQQEYLQNEIDGKSFTTIRIVKTWCLL